VRRVDLEVDGLSVDALVVSCDSGRLVLDLAPDLGEVVVSPPGDVEELSPFLLSGDARGGVGNVDLIVFVGVFALAGQVDELQDERASGHDAVASGEKVSADDVLEHRRLSSRLRSDDDLCELVWTVPQRGPLGGAAQPAFEPCTAWASGITRTIWGRSRESFPMVLNTRSCSLLTTLRSSSPSEAMALVVYVVFCSQRLAWMRTGD
jgi:hypothetical protein